MKKAESTPLPIPTNFAKLVDNPGNTTTIKTVSQIDNQNAISFHEISFPLKRRITLEAANKAKIKIK